MSRGVLRTAIYELPVPVWIDSGALGKTFPTGCRDVTFDVHMPERGGEDGSPPALEGLGDTALRWTQRFAARLPEGRDDAVAICRVGITAFEDPQSDDHHAVVSAVIDEWFDRVRTWVEVVTGQDLDFRHPTHDAHEVGRGLTYVDDEENTLHGLWLTTRPVNPIRVGEWAASLVYAADDRPPRLEHVICRDARASFARDYHRRAVIEAATATELLLVRELQGIAGSLSNKHRKALDGKPTFGTCIRIAKDAGLKLPVEIDRLEQLNSARIAAVHHGESAGTFESVRCVQTCIDFVLSTPADSGHR